MPLNRLFFVIFFLASLLGIMYFSHVLHINIWYIIVPSIIFMILFPSVMRSDYSADNAMDEWSKMRSKGKQYFIIRWGVFYMGSVMSIFFLLKTYLIDAKSWADWYLYLIDLIGFAVGYAWGWIVWRFAENKYKTWHAQKELEQTKDAEES
jgi:hypothetical protein